jgi:hypothetical protein
MRRVFFILSCAAALVAVVPARASAEGSRFAIIVQGASGEEQYATLHRGWVDGISSILRDRFKLDAAHLTVLVEQPKAGEDRSTAENVKAAIARVAKQSKADDLLFVMLIGHGAGDGAEAKFNLIGPDLSITEWNDLLKPVAARIAFVDATSSSFAFLKGLAAPGRVIITATNSYAQRYHTVFADAFIKAVTAPAADTDKNGRISLLEAFVYASRLVAQHFEQNGTLATEHAVLNDTGDGTPRDAAAPSPDGALAAFTYLDAVEVPKSADPEVQQMLQRQQALTEQVDDLRRRRSTLSPQEFDRQFEKLIIDLSLVSRDVRRRSGGY